jgi:hypothetical protein
VQRRIQKTNRGRQTIERGKDSHEIGTLVRQQFCQRTQPLVFGACENHFAHCIDAVAFEKHVLGAAKADSLRAECDCVRRLFRRVGICANAECAEFVRPFHEL